MGGSGYVVGGNVGVGWWGGGVVYMWFYGWMGGHGESFGCWRVMEFLFFSSFFLFCCMLLLLMTLVDD